jgi:protein required for attachment to host cells
MSKNPNILIAIADGEHARIVRPRPDHVLRTERAFDSKSAHRKSSDLGSDAPGASFHSDSSARHGIAPKHDLHRMEKERFARFVATELSRMTDDSAFDNLVIAAPDHYLNVMRDALDDVTRAKLVGTIAKDLIKTPDDELAPHFRDFVPPETPLRARR